MHFSFRRSAIGIFLAIVTAALPGFATAQGGNHGIPQGRQWIWVGIGMVNKSDACAWVTFYWSYKSEAHWRIAGGSNRPRWVAPGQRFGGRERFNHPLLGPQVRTRAEVMSTANGQCTGNRGRPDLTQQINLSPKGPGRDCSADTELLGSRSTNYRLVPNQVGYGCRN
ncbi:MAG TPA: hypothetical protein VFW34_10255 [Candidatus Rubrimentiphilum sp.]|nr:hypothetical protein [Candidatus Rubrimentiphilum sp.]